MGTLTTAISVASLGLGAAMLPEVHKVYVDPESTRSIAPLFLLLRSLFFVILGTALFLKKDKSVRTLAWLSVWYVCCYSYMLWVYYKVGREHPHRTHHHGIQKPGTWE